MSTAGGDDVQLVTFKVAGRNGPERVALESAVQQKTKAS